MLTSSLVGDVEQRPFNQCWLAADERERRNRVSGGGFLLGRQGAPSRAFFINQQLKRHKFQPTGDVGRGWRAFFQVVKDHLDVVLGQPSTRFSDGVTIGDAVQMYGRDVSVLTRHG